MPEEVRRLGREAFQRGLDTPDMSWVGHAEDATAEACYAAGRADERARAAKHFRSRGPFPSADAVHAAAVLERGEHLDN